MKLIGIIFCSLFLSLFGGIKAQNKSEVNEIIIVFKTHVDVGYTNLASKVIHKYRTEMIDSALKVVEENRKLPVGQQFIWTLSGWPMKKILDNWPGQSPERYKNVHQAFKEGHFVVHALPVTVHTEMLEPECLVRGLGFASSLARSINKPLPTGAKMTDVPSHSWIIPTVLNQAGINFLHLGCNGANISPELPLLFWWEGADGSRLLTMYTSGYGSGLIPPKDWPYKTWLAVLMRGNNQGPPNPEELSHLLAKVHKELPGVKVTVGELGDFGNRIIEENPSLPIIKSDMPDSWIHGIMCAPSSTILNRETTFSLIAAESLGTLLNWWGVNVEDKSDIIRDAYENNLMYYEHTWGLSMASLTKYIGSSDYIGQCDNWHYGARWKKDYDNGRFNEIIKSWEEHSDYARKAHQLVIPLLQEEIQQLAESVNITGERTVIYNPLPWKRNGIPAMGYKSFSKKKYPLRSKQVKVDKEKGVIENKYFKIFIDPVKGAIRSVIDKNSNRELVDTDAKHAFGQFVYERFSQDEVAEYCRKYVRDGNNRGYIQMGKPNLPSSAEFPYQCYTPSDCRIELLNDENGSGLEMFYDPDVGGLTYPVSTAIILQDDTPYFDLEITVDKPADPWPEAGWISFPFQIESPQFRIGRNGSVVDPTKDFSISGTNHHLFSVSSGVAIFDMDGIGVGVCGLDAPLVSLGEPGIWKFSKDRTPTRSSVYYNLFNNQWSTNFRFWNEGKWTYRFRIWTYDKYDTEASLITPSYEALYPLRTATTKGSAGILPKEQKGIELSRKGVMVTAFGPDPDGNDGILLRIWEQVGKSGKMVVSLPKGIDVSQAIPVDLRGERKGESIEVKSGKFEFYLNKYTPASFILKYVQ